VNLIQLFIYQILQISSNVRFETRRDITLSGSKNLQVKSRKGLAGLVACVYRVIRAGPADLDLIYLEAGRTSTSHHNRSTGDRMMIITQEK